MQHCRPSCACENRTRTLSALSAPLLAVALLCFVASCYTALGEDLPHVDTCNYCYDCVLDGPPPQPLPTRRILDWQRQQREAKQAQEDGGGRALSTAAAHASKQSRYAAARMLPQSHVNRRQMQAEVGGGSALQQAQQEAVEEEEDPYALPAGVPPVTDLTQLIQPLDSEAKALMPNCTRCRGCSVELSEIHTSLNTFGDGVTFVHGKGATNGWLFFAKVAGSSTRHIVKVNCMPYSKLKGPAKMQECFARVYLSRFQLIMGQRELAEDCGVAELTPRTWLAPVNAIAPKGCKGFGYHIRWHGLWSEEAQGITLHGLYMARKDDLAMSLMAEKMNRTQVVLGAIMDLFTAQCDRHSENVFIRADGGLQFIDNDRALGVVTRCGADSMLLPGTRYHGMLRTGLFHHTQAFYKQNMHKPGFCHGPVDARVLMDYRCYVPNGLIGKSFPPNMQRCLESVARSTIPQIIQRYGLPREKKPALILQHRATDLLRHGFEWTLSNGPPISAAKFRQVHQTPCCALQRSRQFVTCDKCWKPIFDLMDNSTAPEDDPQFAQLP